MEIMTDKVSMELEAEEDGYLIAILKGDGETVPVTEVIGYLGEEGKTSQQLEPQHQKLAQHLQQVPQMTVVRAMMLLISS